MQDKYFGSILQANMVTDRLDAYLTSPVAPVSDPLVYWNALNLVIELLTV